MKRRTTLGKIDSMFEANKDLKKSFNIIEMDSKVKQTDESLEQEIIDN